MNFITTKPVFVCLFALYFSFSKGMRIDRFNPLTKFQEADSNGIDQSEQLDAMLNSYTSQNPAVNQFVDEQETTAETNDMLVSSTELETTPPIHDTEKSETQTPLKESGTGSPCGRHKACSVRDESRQRRIDLLKRTILEKLRLEAPPNVTGHKLPRDSPPMKALYKRYGLDQMNKARLEEEQGEIKSQKVISPAKPPPIETGRSTQNWFFFEFSEEERRDFNVKSADLWVYIRPVETNLTSAVIMLDEYQPVFNYTVNATEVTPRMNLRRGIDLSGHGKNGFWRKISILSLVTGWFKNPERNFGIEVTTKGVFDLIANGKRSEEEGFKPFLEVELVSSHRRTKRNALENCNAEESRCCLYDFLISFEQIGWDWIIFPHAYNAKYCGGDCSIVQLQSMRSTLARHTDIGRPEQTKSCCVAKRFAPLSMLYYDKAANIVYSEIPEMEIVQCECV